MDIYNYRGTDGLYLSTTEARPDPLEPGEYLVPANATIIRPSADILSGEKLGYWIGNSWSSAPVPTSPGGGASDNELRRAICDQIDLKTDELIVYGFTYNGQSIRLTAYDQLNFEGEKNLYLELQQDGLFVESDHFPREIKVGTDDNGSPVMMGVGTLSEYKAIVRTGKAYIRACLDEGWALKRTVATMNRSQLESFEDTRG